MAAAAAAAAHPNEREALEEKIATQGDLVRALKASGGPVRADAGSDFGPVRAPKAEVDAAVAVLLRLKRQAGWPLDRPSGSRLGKDKPPPAGLVTISVAPPSRSPPLGGAGAVMGASHASGSLAGSVHGGGAFGASLGSALSEAFGPFLPTAPLQSPFRSPFHSPFQSPFQSPFHSPFYSPYHSLSPKLLPCTATIPPLTARRAERIHAGGSLGGSLHGGRRTLGTPREGQLRACASSTSTLGGCGCWYVPLPTTCPDARSTDHLPTTTSWPPDRISSSHLLAASSLSRPICT